MSVTTYTVTVVSTDSGNKYFIDGVQQATLKLSRGQTYKFDQSDNSNNTHPLRFSTTENGTHNEGDEYTTGVTTSGTPGSSGAYTQIIPATSAPSTLYYYCTNHSGMGGTANIVNNSTWGSSTWGANTWQNDEIVISLTSPGATTALGTPQSFNLEGWGRQQWSNSGWGVEYSVEPTGVSATVSQGTATGSPITIVELTGVSATASVGEVTPADVMLLTGQVATSAIGELASVGTAVGWGRNGWGEEPYGDSFNKVVVVTVGTQAEASVGTPVVGDIIGLTGQSSTASTGSPTIIGNVTVEPTGLSSTSAVGSISVVDAIGVTGISATSSVGVITPPDLAFGITGLSATITLGETSVTSNPTVTLSGQSLTSSVGSITPADVIGLTGISSTSSVGVITPPNLTLGLTGISATASVGDLFVQAYQAIDTGSNTSYTSVATGSNTSYSDVA